ncbi:MAG: hypothetical protein ITG02_16165 [Patulibacter sp.]|nr:hypothetical protein [Patulibacter sp.]
MPGRFEQAETALLGGSDVYETVMPLVANGIAACDEPFVFAVDDFHVIHARGCHRIVAALIDAVPAGASVIVTSRTLPPLRLARRRVSGTLSELGPGDLRFSLEESDRLLNGSLALGLERGQLEQVDARVSGWGAGLALIAMALRRHHKRRGILDALASSTVNIETYLVEEVLDGSSPELGRFLRRTAILGRLNESLCAAVVDDPDARDMLNAIRRDSLFVSALDPAGTWLRYHDLFAATLARELERREPGMVARLHVRASGWYEDAGMLDEAIEHALRGGDGPRAARLLAATWPTLIGERRHATVRSILDRLPEDRGELTVLCEAVDVLCMISEGVDQRFTYERAEGVVTRGGEDLRVRRAIDRVLVSPFCGDIGRAVRLGREAWQRHADVPDAQIELAPQIGMALWLAGDRIESRRLLEPRVRLPQPSAMRAWIFATLAMLAAEEGDVALADQHAREAADEVEAAGAQTAPELAGVHWVRGEVLRCAGRLAEARGHLDRALSMEERLPGSLGHLIALVLDAQLALAERDRIRARKRARRARSIVDRHADVGTFAARLAAVESALESRSETAPLLGSTPTNAELRVLRQLDGGKTVAQIGADLYLSSNTIKSHVRRLYRRFGTSTREDTVAAARERGLLGAKQRD